VLLRQEIKHLLHCPSTWAVAIISVLLACLTPFLSLLGASIDVISPNGTRTTISGPAALSAWRDIESPLEGEISVEQLEAALSVYQQLIKEYGENIPDDVYIRQGYPIEAYLNILRSYSAGTGTDGLASLAPESVSTFYTARTGRVTEFLSAQLGANTPAYQAALAENAKVQTPFHFYSHRGLENALLNISAIVVVLSLLVCVLCGQLFSAEYQSNSVTILRATRYGRKKLAWAKVFAALFSSTILYVFTVTIYSAICGTLFGWRGFNAPIQLSSYLSVHPFTYGQVYVVAAAVGLLTIWAVTAFTLFISSRMNTPVFVTAIGFGAIILQFLIGSLPSKFFDFLGDILPSSGSSVYGELFRVNYFTVGPIAIWSPVVIVCSAFISVFVFSFLAVKSYCKHEGT